uniref:G-protein coupled receptors family 1 profile domain-containing protein n=1 Tax=Denticeps clupeoides TaxID=299321 RepID=A0AAY4D432_9TELE
MNVIIDVNCQFLFFTTPIKKKTNIYMLIYSLSIVFQQVAYLPVFFLSVLLNAAALRVFFLHRAAWTDTHIYMMNLLVANCLLIIFLPFRVYDAFRPLPKSKLCTALLGLHYGNMYASILTIMCISVHRYIAVRFPIKVHRLSNKRTIALSVCAFIWLLDFTLTYVFYPNNLPEKMHTCYYRVHHSLSLRLFLINIITGFLCPLLIVTFCSLHMILLLKSEGSDQKPKRRFVGVIIANLTVFVVCFTPIHVMFTMQYFHKEWNGVLQEFREVSDWIATTNCCLDSIGYYFLLRNNKTQYRSTENKTNNHMTIHSRSNMDILTTE